MKKLPLAMIVLASLLFYPGTQKTATSQELATHNLAADCTLSCSATVPTIYVHGQPVLFSASASASGCSGSIQYEWDFGDGSPKSSEQNPQHFYKLPATQLFDKPTTTQYQWKLTVRMAGAMDCVRFGVIQQDPIRMPRPDLGIHMTTTLTPTVPGTEVIFNIELLYINPGTDLSPVRNLTVTMTLPQQLAFVSCASTSPNMACSNAGNQVTFSKANFEISFLRMLTLTTKITPNTPGGTLIKNTAIVSGTLNSPDVLPFNNTSTVEVLAINPLVFIPGIAGSSIHVNGEYKWLGDSLTFDRDKTLSLNSTVSPPPAPAVIRDVLRRDIVLGKTIDTYGTLLERLTNPSLGQYREYQVAGNPARRTTNGCDVTGQKSNNPLLFVFAYDWRKSNEIAADQLADYVGCVRKFYGNDVKLDVLAHSMGGLAARRYITKYAGNHGVAKLITMGSPWLGTPKAIDVMHTGRFLDNFGSSLLITAGTIRSLVEYFPGMHQLLPSRAYFDLGGTPYTYDGKSASYADLQKRFDNDYFKASKPVAANAELHNQSGQDDWQNDTSGIQYFHLYGIRNGQRTVAQVIEVTSNDCSRFEFNCYSPTTTYRRPRGEGDGTVTTLSLTRKGNGLNYNAASVRNDETRRLIAFRAADDPCPSDPQDTQSNSAQCRDKYVGHTELAANLRAFCTVLGILSIATPAICANADSQPPQVNQLAGTEESSSALAPAYFLRTRGTPIISVTDAAGKRTNPLADPPDSGIPGVIAEASGINAAEIMLPMNETYTVNFQAGNRPIWIEILKGLDLNPEQAIRYQDLELPAGTPATIKVTPQGVEQLRYDSDKNGTYEAVVNPTVTASGTLALDQIPPNLRFTVTFQRGNATVAITADDAGSGVKNIRYSLDGVRFPFYSSPLTVNVLQTKNIYAFADDNAANRSGAVTYPLATAVASVSAASFSATHLAPESIAAAFGTNLSSTTQSVRTIPLPTTVGGTTVTVKDSAGVERLAPLFYVSPGQVNYQVPAGTAAGVATIIINNGTSAVAVGNIQVSIAAPSLFSANATGQGVGAATALRVRANGSQVYEAVSRFDATLKQHVPVPIDLGPVGDRVFLVLFGGGIRGASDPNRDGNVNESVRVSLGGNTVTPAYAGKQGSNVGLDQINVEIPRSLIGKGDIDVTMTANAKTSNTLKFNIK